MQLCWVVKSSCEKTRYEAPNHLRPKQLTYCDRSFQVFSIKKIYLSVGAIKYLNDTKGLASSEAAVLTGIYDPSMDILCLQTFINTVYTPMVTYCIHFLCRYFPTNNLSCNSFHFSLFYLFHFRTCVFFCPLQRLHFIPLYDFASLNISRGPLGNLQVVLILVLRTIP